VLAVESHLHRCFCCCRRLRLLLLLTGPLRLHTPHHQGGAHFAPPITTAWLIAIGCRLASRPRRRSGFAFACCATLPAQQRPYTLSLCVRYQRPPHPSHTFN